MATGNLPTVNFLDSVRRQPIPNPGHTDAQPARTHAQGGQVAAPRDHALVRTVSNALLSEAARDLDEAPQAPRDERNDLERALMKHNSVLAENATLRGRVTSLEERLASTERGYAADSLRNGDQVEFLQKQNGTLQEQRDQFANYAIELRTRMRNLTSVMGTNAANVEELILTTIDTIEKDMLTRVSTLRTTLMANAQTAAALIAEAEELAKDDAVVRLAERRPVA